MDVDSSVKSGHSASNALPDVEKGDHDLTSSSIRPSPEIALYEGEAVPPSSSKWYAKLLSGDVIETRGMQPVPVEERTDPQYWKQFFHWFTADVNILCFSTGGIATFGFGMNLRDAALTILFFNLLCCIPAAYVITLAPKTGMRQMIFSRYSFGYWGATVPVLFNLMTMFGYGITNSVVGGQTLAAASGPHFPWEVGVVVVNLIALIVSFGGLKFLSWYEKIAWVPAFIAFLALIGLNAHKIADQQDRPSATAPVILSFGGIVAGFQLTWTAIAPDLCVYTRKDVNPWKLAMSIYAGLVIPVTGLMILGAAVGSSNNPTWHEGKVTGQVYGLMTAIMEPYGSGGKFLNFLFAMSIMGNLSLSFYAKSLNLQLLLPFLHRVPRPWMAVLTTVIIIPIAAARAHSIYTDLINFLSIIGYWISSYLPVVLLEHWIFRKNDTRNYDATAWDNPKLLPVGVAAIVAYACGWAVAIPSMDETWYVGPIAKHTGDIGFELAFAASAIVYPVLRFCEIKLTGR